MDGATMPGTLVTTPTIRPLPVHSLNPNAFSQSVYGDIDREIDGLLASIRASGVLVPLVVVRDRSGWEILSGHRRFFCAKAVDLDEVPCQILKLEPDDDKRSLVLEYNRQRQKTFRQMMREADALEEITRIQARRRQWDNLEQNRNEAEGRNSDARGERGRSDVSIARAIGLGGKDLYRQARAVWKAAEAGDPRAQSGVEAIDQGTKTIHAAYKDLRRRDRFASGFQPTPYDVWAFRHDRAFGVPHPGSIPPAIIAHALHYFTEPGDLVVDPMAGGGTTIDVCASMGRRCLAYDLHPVRPDVVANDVNIGFPQDASGCHLVFVDPPYHTMKAGLYPGDGVGEAPLLDWVAFLDTLARHAFASLKPAGHIALLLANQTEKDLPRGVGYIDHAFLGYKALTGAGFAPQRRISCPMDGAYLPQHVKRARADGRMLGQVRDLLVMKKPV